VLEERKPITDDPTATDATEVTLAVSGTVEFLPGFNTSANRIAVADAIRAYVNARDIGDAAGVDLGGIYAAIYGAVPSSVKDVDLTVPAGDTAIAAGTIAVADVAGLAYS
jgi:phage-related baseplate assembly protein